MSTHGTADLIDSAAYTTAQTSESQPNPGHRGAHVIVDVTVQASGASITPSIVGICKGIEYTLLTGSVISSTGTTVLKIYPGITAAANAAASDVLPQEWKLDVAVTGGSTTFSAKANLLK